MRVNAGDRTAGSCRILAQRKDKFMRALFLAVSVLAASVSLPAFAESTQAEEATPGVSAGKSTPVHARKHHKHRKNRPHSRAHRVR